jgi:hypothetical protein
MAKNDVRSWDPTASNNTDIAGIGIQGTNAVSNFDGALRTVMAQVADVDAGTQPVNDTWTFCDPADATKRARLDAGNVTAGQTRVITAPDFNLDLAGVWDTTKTTVSAAASYTKTDLSAYRTIRLTGFFAPATDNQPLCLRFSTNNGVSYDNGASDYNFQTLGVNGATVTGGRGASDRVPLTNTTGNAANEGASFDIVITDFNQALQCRVLASTTEIDTGGLEIYRSVFSRRASTTARDALQLIFVSGNIASGYVIFQGLR